MGRLTVRIDEEVLACARAALGTRTKRETILVALEEAIRRKRLLEALQHRGRVELGLTAEELLQGREQA